MDGGEAQRGALHPGSLYQSHFTEVSQHQQMPAIPACSGRNATASQAGISCLAHVVYMKSPASRDHTCSSCEGWYELGKYCKWRLGTHCVTREGHRKKQHGR